MNTIKRINLSVLLFSIGFLFCINTSRAETIKIATYNVEQFMMMFDQDRMPLRSQDQTELFRDEEDQYEVAKTMLLPKFNADITVIIECCSQDMLEYFNKKWLKEQYSFVKVFKGNVEGQYLAMLAKPGFKPLEIREFYKEKDSTVDKRIQYEKEGANLAEENLLFSRGPAFVLFETPQKNKIWIGCTHAKSKSGNSKAVTEWRIRELNRTRQLCEELLTEGKTDKLLIVGDFNDDFGMDNYEQQIGTDAIAAMIQGTDKLKLACLDKVILERNPGAASYHCEIKPPKYRSFLDHMFAGSEMAKANKDIYLIDDSIAFSASDHLPLVGIFDLPTPENSTK